MTCFTSYYCPDKIQMNLLIQELYQDNDPSTLLFWTPGSGLLNLHWFYMVQYIRFLTEPRTWSSRLDYGLDRPENNWQLLLKNIWRFSHVDSSRISHKIKSLILSPTKLKLRAKIMDLSLNNTICIFFLLCLYNDFQAFGAYCSPKNLNIAANHKSVSFPNNLKSLKSKNPPSQILKTFSEGQVTVCRHITVDAFSSSCYLRKSEQLLPFDCILPHQPPQ